MSDPRLRAIFICRELVITASIAPLLGGCGGGVGAWDKRAS
jgi:hypothetical protein